MPNMNRSRLHRSNDWFDTPELYGWLRNAALKSRGFTDAVSKGRPIIGICNSWSELTHCNDHLRDLAESVKRGVLQAGGIPMEFPVMSLGEYNMRPTAMLYRNLMSMDVEESIKANPLDGVVMLGGCDKTTPGMLMGAASADVPTIMVTGGPQLKAWWRGEELGTCTDCRRYQNELLAGRLSQNDWIDLQENIISGPGHCGVMGTASTMSAMAESLGMALPGNTATPAAHSDRKKLAEWAGHSVIEIVKRDLRPSKLLTMHSFENAIRTLHAIGGSTNAIIHLIAIAGRVGINLNLDAFDRLSKDTPVLLNLKPSGQKLMEDFYYAGGLSAVLNELGNSLHLNAPSVTCKSMGANIENARIRDDDVIRNLSNPINKEGGLAVLKGTLAPDGALIKQSAASPELLVHQGRAIVFESHDDMLNRIDNPDLEIKPDDVLVMRNSGPLGGPGMPESGFLPIPRKLLKMGIRDMVRISDARMSGTAFGTVVVHVTPESEKGGPLAAVRTGDMIDIDVPGRRLDLMVDCQLVNERLSNRKNTGPLTNRGYMWIYAKHVLQADKGCDFDFLRNL